MPIPEESISSKGIHDNVAYDCDLLQSENFFLTSTIRKFADAAAQAGIRLETLIDILDSGVPIEAVFELIQVRLYSSGESGTAA
jgi:hypothetical protein